MAGRFGAFEGTVVALARKSARRSVDKVLSTKRSPHGLSKGTGAPNHGRLTTKGHYIPQPWKSPRFASPPSTPPSSLTPYVDTGTPKLKTNLPKSRRLFSQ